MRTSTAKLFEYSSNAKDKTCSILTGTSFSSRQIIAGFLAPGSKTLHGKGQKGEPEVDKPLLRFSVHVRPLVETTGGIPALLCMCP